MTIYKKYLIAVFLPVLLSSCNGTVHKVVEYPTIPLQFTQIDNVPDFPITDNMNTITVEQLARNRSELNTYACNLYSRYRELLRYSSFGTQMIEEPNKRACDYEL